MRVLFVFEASARLRGEKVLCLREFGRLRDKTCGLLIPLLPPLYPLPHPHITAPLPHPHHTRQWRQLEGMLRHKSPVKRLFLNCDKSTLRSSFIQFSLFFFSIFRPFRISSCIGASSSRRASSCLCSVP